MAEIDVRIESWKKRLLDVGAYSGAAKPQFRRFGNRLTGTGNRT